MTIVERTGDGWRLNGNDRPGPELPVTPLLVQNRRAAAMLEMRVAILAALADEFPGSVAYWREEGSTLRVQRVESLGADGAA